MYLTYVISIITNEYHNRAFNFCISIMSKAALIKIKILSFQI